MRVYLIAGEQSGDLLGARLMAALRDACARHPKIKPYFFGIGGEQMQAQGLHSLFAMSDLSLMGFVEILPHIPRLRRRIEETVQDILLKRPDVIVTIDSPGFCFRVAKKLRKHWPKGQPGIPRFVHYVAPSVWAYKPGRAKKLAITYDSVLTLLPFEPPFFTAHGMQAVCVGHPLVEQPETGDAEAFRQRHGMTTQDKLLAVLPGSRAGELKRHVPVLREATAILAQHHPELVTVIPAVPHLLDAVRQATTHWPTKLILADQSHEKWDAFAAADIAIAKSGTVTLELALARTPMVVMYKVHPLSAWLMRRMIRTPYVTLVNILEQRKVIPELLQQHATPVSLAEAANHLLAHEAAQEQQLAAFDDALRKLGLGDARSPSQKAADVLLQHRT